MKINSAGLDLIKEAEGLRLTAYQDSVGVWTIGYGHTGPDVHKGLTITAERATELLRDDLADAEKGVTRQVKTPLTENQFSALVSFTFNLGGGALEKSTLLKMLNRGDKLGASAEFGRWVRAGKKMLPGLVTRREAERKLFLS